MVRVYPDTEIWSYKAQWSFIIFGCDVKLNRIEYNTDFLINYCFINIRVRTHSTNNNKYKIINKLKFKELKYYLL